MKRIVYLGYLLVFISGVLNPANAQDYSEASLGFDPGEFEMVQAPYPEDLKPIIIPRFRNMMRLGKPDSYGLSANPIPQEVYRSQSERRELLSQKQEGIYKTFELMEMQHRNTDINLEELAREFQPTINRTSKMDDPVRKTLYWSGQLKTMAPYYLKPKTLSKYWCKEGDNCIPEGQGANAVLAKKKNRPTWGGGTDEFTRLRNWQAYVKNEVPKFQEWAKQINEQEAYIVGTTYIKDYDFNHEGFIIRIDAVEPKVTRSSLLTYPKKNDKDSFFARSEVNGNLLAGILIKMNPEKAEQVVETMEAYNPRSRELYFVYKTKIGFETTENTTQINDAGPPLLIQEPSSSKVEFFLDEQLKEKLFEVDLSK